MFITVYFLGGEVHVQACPTDIRVGCVKHSSLLAITIRLNYWRRVDSSGDKPMKIFTLFVSLAILELQ